MSIRRRSRPRETAGRSKWYLPRGNGGGISAGPRLSSGPAVSRHGIGTESAGHSSPVPVHFLVPAVLVAFVLVSGCIGDLKKPEASVTGVSLSGITATETGLDISVAIFNQNPVPVRIEHTDLRLSFWNGSSWAPLGTAYKGMFQVHPSGETRILVPVTLNNTALCDLLWHLIVNSDVKVRVNGTVFADLLLASYPVSFEDERVLKRGDTLLLLANAAFRSVTGVNILPQRPL